SGNVWPAGAVTVQLIVPLWFFFGVVHVVSWSNRRKGTVALRAGVEVADDLLRRAVAHDPLQSEDAEYGGVGDREEDVVVVGGVVLVHRPRRHGEEVAPLPGEPDTVDDRLPPPPEHLVDGGVDVAVGQRPQPGLQQLDGG